MGRTVLHGVDQSGASFADIPERANMAHVWYDEDLQARHIWDETDGIFKPIEYIAFEYDVREKGGATGWYGLDVVVPAGTIILDGMLHIREDFVSGGAATLTLKVESAAGVAGDIVNAVAVGVLVAGLLDITPVGTAATAILCTQDREIKANVGTAAFTAGNVRGYLRCVRSLPLLDLSSSSSSLSSSSSSSVSASSASSNSSSSSSSLSSQSTSQSSKSSQSTSQSSKSSQSTSQSSASSQSVSSSSSSSLSASSSSSSSNSSSSSSG